MTRIQIELPDAPAQAAREAGLLTPTCHSARLKARSDAHFRSGVSFIMAYQPRMMLSMQATLVRRVLGDAVGCVTLAVLVELLVIAWPGETTPNKFKELFPPIYALMAILGYAFWIEKEKKMPDASWLRGALWSVAAGAVSLIGDVLIGHLFNPSVPLFKAPLSAGIPFAVTVCLCPGFTFITIAGWTPSLVIRPRKSQS